MKKTFLILVGLATLFLLNSCGFHVPSSTRPPAYLCHVFIQSAQPYSQITQDIKKYLSAQWAIQVLPTAEKAAAIITLTEDEPSEELLALSGNQQTRQYRLRLGVNVTVTDAKGHGLRAPQTLSETRVLTLQVNQILGSTMQKESLYRAMRQSLAQRILEYLTIFS